MQAQRMMSASPITALDTETVGVVLDRMCGKGMRLLPVLDDGGKVLGVGLKVGQESLRLPHIKVGEPLRLFCKRGRL